MRTPMHDLREACVQLSITAGAAIMAIYRQEFSVATKADDSPLTQADLAAHRILVAGLQALTPGIPVLSEEAADISWARRQAWPRYWLVDPLDGTREFIKKNGEFTVNIALIDGNQPVLGVVYAPALAAGHEPGHAPGPLWHGERGVGAYLRQGDGEQRIQCRQPACAPLQVAASRSHLDARTTAFLARMGDVQRLGLGSSLKFCKIAQGLADLYPRFGPTSEWDTGAGQCVLEAAGGAVLRLDASVLDYNRKDSLLNPDFIALGDVRLPWQEWLNG